MPPTLNRFPRFTPRSLRKAIRAVPRIFLPDHGEIDGRFDAALPEQLFDRL